MLTASDSEPLPASPSPAKEKEHLLQRQPAAPGFPFVAPTRSAIARDARRSPATPDGSVPYRPRQTNEKPPARDTWPDPATSDARATRSEERRVGKECRWR